MPSIEKNLEKCGGGLVGHGFSIDVIYIGGAQAGAVVRAKWPILRYSVFANSIRWREGGTIRRKLLIARDHRGESCPQNSQNIISLNLPTLKWCRYQAKIVNCCREKRLFCCIFFFNRIIKKQPVPRKLNMDQPLM